MKIEFYELFGFLRSWPPFPLFYGINRRFCQQWIAANYLRQLQFAAGRDHDFHLDGSNDMQFAG